MRGVAPSVLAREQLHRPLAGGVDRETNIVSALVETRLVVQELVEGEHADFLGDRGRYERRAGGQVCHPRQSPPWRRRSPHPADLPKRCSAVRDRHSRMRWHPDASSTCGQVT